MGLELAETEPTRQLDPLALTSNQPGLPKDLEVLGTGPLGGRPGSRLITSTQLIPPSASISSHTMASRTGSARPMQDVGDTDIIDVGMLEWPLRGHLDPPPFREARRRIGSSSLAGAVLTLTAAGHGDLMWVSSLVRDLRTIYS